jgi:hypothetical protein
MCVCEQRATSGGLHVPIISHRTRFISLSPCISTVHPDGERDSVSSWASDTSATATARDDVDGDEVDTYSTHRLHRHLGGNSRSAECVRLSRPHPPPPYRSIIHARRRSRRRWPARPSSACPVALCRRSVRVESEHACTRTCRGFAAEYVRRDRTAGRCLQAASSSRRHGTPRKSAITGRGRHCRPRPVRGCARTFRS